MSLIRLSFIFILFVVSASNVAAQQTTRLELYRHNWALLNPAAFPRNYFEDAEELNYLGATARLQTVKIEGAPQHYNIRYEGIIDVGKSDMKLGGFATRDEVGAISDVSLQGNFAYLFSAGFKAQHKIGIGITVGYLNQRVELEKVNWKDPLSIPTDLNNRSLWNATIGIFYYYNPANGGGGGPSNYADKHRKNSNRQQRSKRVYPPFYAGVSVRNLVSSYTSSTVTPIFDTYLKTQYTAIAGGVFNNWEPSIWLRYLPNVEYQTLGVNSAVSTDFNIRYLFLYAWTGVGISTNGTANAEFGSKIYFDKSSDNCFQFGLGVGSINFTSKAIPIGLGGPSLETFVGYTF